MSAPGAGAPEVASREPRLPLLGAQLVSGGALFGAYATGVSALAVRRFHEDGSVIATDAMGAVGGGYHQVFVPGVAAGALYKLVLDGRELPDPYARFLPFGVHGPACVVAPRYVLENPGVGSPLAGQVIYELHVGTFTPEGTYDAARGRLRYLAGLGVHTIELMPVAAFAGTRGWGYDGVAHYAPFAPYGSPDALRHLIDDAHGLGLSVLLDVVYNHFGPAGSYLSSYSPDYFTRGGGDTPWGEMPNFANPAMRRYVIDNAMYWLDELGFDGLRLDAIHTIHDPSEEHVLQAITRGARARGKHLLFAEDARNDPGTITGLGFDAVWADDFHHQVRVTLTGEKDGYFSSFAPGVQGVAEAINRGWLYEGQVDPHMGKPRGAPARALPAESLVYCIQNHDQIGNRALGDRLDASVSIEAYRAASVLLLFLPMTALLFMGQEWAASTPFLYFTDHEGSLGQAIVEGRRREFGSFASFSDPESRARIPDPQALGTFMASKLRWEEQLEEPRAGVLRLYRELLRLRRTDPVLQHVSRSELVAEARGDVLVVRRSLGDAVRVLCVSFGSEAVSLADLELPGEGLVPLLASQGEASGEVLPPRCAVILAGSSGRSGAPEGRPALASLR